jgi:hypothetical protein
MADKEQYYRGIYRGIHVPEWPNPLLQAEYRGWQMAHDSRPCGHPRAFYRDRNWPDSERNYDYITRTSEPPLDYHCELCDLENEIKILRTALMEAAAALVRAQEGAR